jgi:hypothetical protein
MNNYTNMNNEFKTIKIKIMNLETIPIEKSYLCNFCEIIKPQKDMVVRAREDGTYKTYLKCMACKYILSDKKTIKKRQLRYRIKNNDKIKEYQKKYRDENKENIKARVEKCYAKNKEKYTVARKLAYNKEKHREYYVLKRIRDGHKPPKDFTFIYLKDPRV